MAEISRNQYPLHGRGFRDRVDWIRYDGTYGRVRQPIAISYGLSHACSALRIKTNDLIDTSVDHQRDRFNSNSYI